MRKLCYQLRIHIVDSEPQIWRRVLVPADIDLVGLHEIIQSAFGWCNYHLYCFETVVKPSEPPTLLYTMPIDDEEPMPVLNLRDVLSVGESLSYTYDFGDDWLHHILCEALMICPPRIRLPKCIDGEMHHPIEDIGGIHAYQYFCEVIKNPDKDPEMLAEYIEWQSKRILKYDPTKFSPKDVHF